MNIHNFNVRFITKDMIDRLSIVLFILIFPIDSTWYVLGVVHSTPKLPVGFMCFLVALLIVFPYNILSSSVFRTSLLVIFLLCVTGVIAATQSPFFDYEWLNLFSWYIAMLSLGAALGRNSILDQPMARWLIIVTTLFCSALCSLVLWGGWGQDLNYLRPASALTIAGMLSLVLARSYLMKVIIFVSVLLTLTTLTSRTSIYLWLFVPLLAIFTSGIGYGRDRAASRVIAWAIKVLLAAIWVTLTLTVILPTLAHRGDSRIAPEVEIQMTRPMATEGNGKGGGVSAPSDLPEGIDIQVTDTSIHARLELLSKGWAQIVKNPWLGQYNGYLSYGNKGSYIHSILSHWQQFGVISFAILLIFMSWALVTCFRIKVQPAADIGMLLMPCTCLAAIAARSYVSTEIYFAAGFVIGAWQSDRSTQSAACLLKATQEIHAVQTDEVA